MKHLHNLKRFLARYNELWLGPIALALFVLSESLVTQVDPRAVPYTLDAFQKIVFGHAAFAAATFSALLAIRLTFPDIFLYLIDHFNSHFNQLSTWEKLKLSFSVFACYVLGLLLAMLIL